MEPPIHLPDVAASMPEAGPAEPEEHEIAAPEIRYGGFWRRTGAYLLDAFVVAIVGLPATVLTGTVYGSPAATAVSIVTGLLGFAYMPFCWSRWGMTVGDSLMGLRVVRLEDMQRISWWRALGRSFALFLAVLPFGLGIFWIGWEPRKRGWHDRLADTLVLRVPSLRERQDPRRRWAVAATSIGAVALIFNLIVGVSVALSVATHGYRDANGELVGSQLLSISALQEGDCFDTFLNSLASVSATRCSALHTYEVFGTHELRDGSYPTDAEMQQLASDACISSFEPYVGVAFDASKWYGSYIAPTPESWLVGERTLTCFLANTAQTKVRGSARGTGT